MATERIDIVISQQGGQPVINVIHHIGQAGRTAATGMDFLKRALGLIAGALAVDKVREYADAWAAASGKIAIATKSQVQAAAVMGELFKVAQRTGVGLTDTVELYSKVARAGKELGVSQQRIIDFTEGVGRALAVQGVSATDARGALLQLGQALGSGIVRAEEFNSVLEGAPTILQVVADNIKGVDGSLAKLRQRVVAGKQSSKEFFEAFEKGAPALERAFAQAPVTISRGLTLIENAIIRFVGQTDKQFGISSTLGKGLKFIADNFDQIGKATLVLGAVLAAAFAPAVVLGFVNAFKSLFLVIAANPFVALGAAVAGALAYLYLYGDEIQANAEGTASLKDVALSTAEAIGEAFRAMGEFAVAGFQTILDAGTALNRALLPIFSESTQSWTASYNGFFDDVGTGFEGVARGVARVVDAIAGLIVGLAIGINRTLGGIPEIFETAFKQSYNFAAKGIEDIVNVAIEGVNVLREAVGVDLIEPLKVQKLQVDAEYYRKYGESIMDSINEGMASVDGRAEGAIKGIFGRAAEFKASRDELSRLNNRTTGKDQADLGIALGNPGKPLVDEKESKKALDQLRSLLNTIDPIAGAMLEMAKAREVLTKAEQFDHISAEQHAEYLIRLQEHYKDILNPMGKVNRELTKEAELLNMNAAAREVETRVRQIQLDLIQSTGKDVSEAELTQLRAKIGALRELAELTQAQDNLLQGSVGARKDNKTQFQATQNLLGDQNSGFTKTDAFKSVGSGNEDLFAGTQAQIDANVEAYRGMYERIDQLRQLNLISEEEAGRSRALVDVKAQETRLSFQSQFYGTLAGLANSGNKKIAAIGKAAAVAQATIDGTLAVQKALASAPPPLNYAMAAAVGAVAAANVAQILGIGFESGGYTGNGGRSQPAGIVHGQEFVMNADATARNRPLLEAMNDGKAPKGGGVGGGQAPVNVKVVNAFTPEAVQQHLDNPEGHKIIINAIQQNPEAVKQAIS